MAFGTEPEPPAEVLAFYARGKEDQRLIEKVGVLERHRTEQLLLRHLPDPLALVLDVGGGTGHYALWLAARGYAVHLVDPVPLHLDQARARSAAQPAAALASIRQGAARRLEWPAEQEDAVLLLGPLYHLPDRSDRLAALLEVIGRTEAEPTLLGASSHLFAVGRKAS